GAYIPRYRIKIEEIARVWGDNPDLIKKGLLVCEKSVPDIDEDAATIAVEAARNAVRRNNIDPKEIGAIYVGSESHPYAVKPTATIVAEAIQATPDLTAADFEFACKAGTAAIQTCMGEVTAGMVDYGMAIGSDVSQSAPGDVLEYTTAAGGAAYIIGKRNLIAKIEDTISFTTDTPDFWRREGMNYPMHGGRFTGAPAYFKHIVSATKNLMMKNDTEPRDYDYVVFHQPNGKFPLKAARMLGFSEEQVRPGLVVSMLGNTYSGSSLIGLAAVLDMAKAGSRILMTSFGSGAGSDSFCITVTDGIEDVQGRAPTVQELLKNPKHIDYAVYAKHKGKIVM
ncbi:MAG: hydroxymethylglutaryl-CoA synthase, partial [Methanocellales archaeon]|nr:hydroxymethylglutaryl-CoA synthase [Methanocellales archaeon]